MTSQRLDGRTTPYPHRYFGLWADFESEDHQNLNEAIRNGYVLEDRQRIAWFLAKSKVVLTTSCMSDCPICRKEAICSDSWRSDGTWLWPSELSHLILEHFIALPDEFVQHIRDRGYRVETEEFDLDTLDWWPMRKSDDSDEE